MSMTAWDGNQLRKEVEGGNHKSLLLPSHMSYEQGPQRSLLPCSWPPRDPPHWGALPWSPPHRVSRYPTQAQLSPLTSSADTPHGCPNLCFCQSTRLDGKKGLKPASVGLLYRAASRSFLQHKRNEIELARLLHEPAALCRGAPGRCQAILIRYSKINKGAELLLNMQSCARLWRETPGQRRKQRAQGCRCREVARGQQPQIRLALELPERKGGRTITWAQPECGGLPEAVCGVGAL